MDKSMIRPLIRTIITLIMFFPALCWPLDVSGLKPSPFTSAEKLGELQNSQLSEVSGITLSGYHSDLFWVINDGGNKPVVYAINRHGDDLGQIRIRGTGNQDWEDLDTIHINNKSYLVISETGDNSGTHPTSYLYLLEEPKQESTPKKVTLANVAWKIRFKYEDEPHDCEALAYDAENKRFLLLTKRTVPAILYELPFNAESSRKVLTAKEIARITHIPQPDTLYLLANPFVGRYASQPTAIDISPDGQELAILTYRYAYLYTRSGQKNWESTINNAPPTLIQLPPLSQAESITFDSDSNLIVTTEKRPAPIYVIKRVEK